MEFKTTYSVCSYVTSQKHGTLFARNKKLAFGGVLQLILWHPAYPYEIVGNRSCCRRSFYLMITICFPHLILKSWTNYTGCIYLSDIIVLHLCRMNRYDYGMQTQVYVFSFLLEQGVIATKCLAWLVSFSAVKRCMCLSNNVIECNPPKSSEEVLQKRTILL